MTMQSLDTGSITSFNMSGNILVHLEPAKHIPVFCLFTVYEDDCGIDKNGQYIINLSEEKKETIKKHFPKANSVAIITEPYKFLDDVSESMLMGYKQPTWEPKEPEIHSIVPPSSTSARLVFRLYMFFDQFSIVE